MRPFTVGLLMLRAKELNLSIFELELLTIGDVLDMLIERNNDAYEWPYAPTLQDFDRFGG